MWLRYEHLRGTLEGLRPHLVVCNAGGLSFRPPDARRLREELTDFLSEDFAALADLLAAVRAELRDRGISVNAETWQRAIDARLRALVAQRRPEEARQHLLHGLGIGELPAATAG